MNHQNNLSLKEHFQKYFSLKFANTPDLLEEVYRIRYQVYCQELCYEPAEKFPDQMEKDEYDPFSVHYLLEHSSSKNYVGCVRVVFYNEQNLDAKFPFEKVCPHNLDFSEKNRRHFCEVSRLAVKSQFRRRLGEAERPEGLIFLEKTQEKKNDRRRQFPTIALSLYWTAFMVALKYDRDAFVVMERSLSRHLKRCGLISHQIGEYVSYRGRRAPFLMKPKEIFAQNLNKYIDGLDDFVENLKQYIVFPS